MKSTENSIEWLKGDKSITATFSQGKYITMIRKLAEGHSEECKILRENDDGTVVAEIPLCWLKINPRRKMSEEERALRRERAKRARAHKRESTAE